MTLEVYFEGPNQEQVVQMFEFTVVNNKIIARPVDFENKSLEPEFSIKFREGRGAVEGTVKSEVETKWPGEGVPYPKKKRHPSQKPEVSKAAEKHIDQQRHGAQNENPPQRSVADAPFLRSERQFPVHRPKPDDTSTRAQQDDKIRPVIAPIQTVPHQERQKELHLKKTAVGEEPSASKVQTDGKPSPEYQERIRKVPAWPPASKASHLEARPVTRASSPQGTESDGYQLPRPCDHAVEEWLLGHIHRGRENLRNFEAVQQKLCVQENDREKDTSNERHRLH